MGSLISRALRRTPMVLFIKLYNGKGDHADCCVCSGECKRTLYHDIGYLGLV